ncbi:MAG: cytochrome b/b6 domain-containing protein [Gammaproteobacteria bacterium]|nr:cytochrome b/b6 domain-containing protein [Gammaproteobacteria bacterium]
MKDRILVWDLPTRIFHWTLAASFAGAFLTAESERWRDVHVMLGFTALGLVAFRLCWGLIGTRYARFSEFVRGPAEVTRYLGSLLSRQPRHYVGHNPAGALAIVALLALAVLVCASGWLLYADVGGEVFEELHEGISFAMLAVVGVHVAGVVMSSVLHRENLVRAMIDGHKEGPREAGIAGSRALIGVTLAAAIAGFWVWSMAAGDATTGAQKTEHASVQRYDD